MSLNGALSNALTGLNAASWGAQIVSSNLANAGTAGYGRRDLALSALTADAQGGVRVTAVTRQVNAALLTDRRHAQARFAHGEALAKALTALETRLGLPGEAGSLQDRIARFEASLVSAASQPESDVRLRQVLGSAQDVVQGLNAAGDTVQALRAEADRSIATMVARLNDGLTHVADLNTRITAGRAAGQSTAALEDTRQAAIDGIADIVPLRAIARPLGKVALVSEGGALLLDGRAPEYGFQPRGTMAAQLSFPAGDLSGLTRNGAPIPNATMLSQFAGGALEAQFKLRDGLLPDAQRTLDALALDLAARFQAPETDASLAPADAGLFTDAAARADPGSVTGLSQRMTLNSRADPDQGGALWRLRAGLGAVAPGAPGDATTLSAMADALSRSAVPASPELGVSAGSFSGHLGMAVSSLSLDRDREDGRAAQAWTRLQALEEMRAADGVDTDAEMQRLLLIEKAYQANARVISMVDELLDTLTRI